MKSGILELRLHWTLIILVVQISVFSSGLDNRLLSRHLESFAKSVDLKHGLNRTVPLVDSDIWPKN